MQAHWCEHCWVPGRRCILRERGQCDEARKEREKVARRPAAHCSYRDIAHRHADLADAARVDARVILAYPRGKAEHGLGVNARHTAAVLEDAAAVEAADPAELEARIGPRTRAVVVQGAYQAPVDLAATARRNPAVRCVLSVHSNLAFLAVEPDLAGQLLEAARSGPGNLAVAGVSHRLAAWIGEALGVESPHLPNLYDLDGVGPAARPPGEAVRVGAFGAMRLQKHHPVAAGAAAVVARRTGRPVELHVNTGRGGDGILRTVRAICTHAEGLTLVEHPWRPHAEFAELVGTMDVCLQPSATETFNYVTADACARGVPTVVGEAIEWMGPGFTAAVDDPVAFGVAAVRLLNDPEAGARARTRLEHQQANARLRWREFLATCPGPAGDPDPPAPRAHAAPAPRHRNCARATDEPCGCNHVACTIHGRVPVAACRECPDFAPRTLTPPTPAPGPGPARPR